MEDRSELEGALVRVLQILHDYADALILVGGWVPYLHLMSGRAAVSAPRTSLTSDADLLIPGGCPPSQTEQNSNFTIQA